MAPQPEADKPQSSALAAKAKFEEVGELTVGIRPSSMAWSPDGGVCAIVVSGSVVFWPSLETVEMPEEFKEFEDSCEPLWQTVWRPDGRQVAVLAGGRLAAVIDVAESRISDFFGNVSTVWWEKDSLFSAPTASLSRAISSWEGAKASLAIRLLPENAIVVSADPRGRAFILYGNWQVHGDLATRSPKVVLLSSDLKRIVLSIRASTITSSVEEKDVPPIDRIVAHERQDAVAWTLSSDTQFPHQLSRLFFAHTDRGREVVRTCNVPGYSHTWLRSNPVIAGLDVFATVDPWNEQSPRSQQDTVPLGVLASLASGNIVRLVHVPNMIFAAISPDGRSQAIAVGADGSVAVRFRKMS